MCGHARSVWLSPWRTWVALLPEAFRDRFEKGETHWRRNRVGRYSCTIPGEVTVSNVRELPIRSQSSSRTCRLWQIRGDVGMGGNWFFLVDMQNVHNARKQPASIPLWIWNLRMSRNDCFYLGDPPGPCGKMGSQAPIARRSTTLSLFGPSHVRGVDGKNFVLCPAKHTIDRLAAPGTSAKLACLYA